MVKSGVSWPESSDEITAEQTGEGGKKCGGAGYPNQPVTRRLLSKCFQQGRRLKLESPRRFRELANVRPKFAKGGYLPAAKRIPMPLVDTEQFDKHYHRVVFSQPMFIAPLGNGLGEILVEVGRLCFGCGHYFEGKSRSAADSISANNFRCQV